MKQGPSHSTELMQQLSVEAFRMLSGYAAAWPLRCSPQTMNQILKTVLSDHPELFWFEGKWTTADQNGISWAIPIYSFPKDQIPDARQQLESCVRQFAFLTTGSESHRARYVYDWILNHVQYGMSGTQGQTAYDALVQKQAVCKGLSKAYQLILRELGIFSTLAEGSMDGIHRHIWNVVCMDGQNLHVDLCMGYPCFSGWYQQQSGYPQAFGLTETQIRKTHHIL